MRRFIYIIIFLFLFLMPLEAEAKEKKIEVDLTDQNLKNYTFTITYDSEQPIAAFLVSPNGGVYEFVQVGIGKMECTISKATRGVWIVRITNDTIDENGNQNENENDVPDVKITVSAAKETQTEVVQNNIKIGRDITGLKVYFIDDILVVEWSDDSCGNVNVKITNLDNSQILANETISKKKFELQIDETIRNISVSVCPSSSSNIPGAAQIYNIDNSNNPDAEVIFPDYNITNKDRIMCDVSMNDTYSIMVQIDNATVFSRDYTKPGTYEIEIPISNDGINDIVLFLIDENGNKKSYKYSLVKDTVAPSLTMNKEYHQLTTSKDMIEVSGTVSGQSELTLNELWIPVSTDGYFAQEIELHEGTNKYVIIAKDLAGNVTEYPFDIVYAPKDTSWTIRDIAIVAVLAGLILFWTTSKFRKSIKTKIKKIPDEKIEDEFDEPEQEQSLKNKKFKLPKVNIQHKNVMNINDYISYFIVIISVVYIFGFVLQVSVVGSGSMEPTLCTHDIAIYNKLAYIQRTPQKGDIVQFRSQELNKVISKRIIAVGGDTVAFHDGYVYINDSKVEETYIDKEVETNCTKIFEVPKGYYFVLGDNRANSYDSREWTNPYIEEKEIKSKYIFKIPISIFYN